MAFYLAPLVRGFVIFVNRLTNATEPELGARSLVRGLVSRLTGLSRNPSRASHHPTTTRDPGQDLQSPAARKVTILFLRAVRVAVARARARVE